MRHRIASHLGLFWVRDTLHEVGLDSNETEPNPRHAALRLRDVVAAATGFFLVLTTFHHYDIKLSYAHTDVYSEGIGGCRE